MNDTHQLNDEERSKRIRQDACQRFTFTCTHSTTFISLVVYFVCFLCFSSVAVRAIVVCIIHIRIIDSCPVPDECVRSINEIAVVKLCVCVTIALFCAATRSCTQYNYLLVYVVWYAYANEKPNRYWYSIEMLKVKHVLCSTVDRWGAMDTTAPLPLQIIFEFSIKFTKKHHIIPTRNENSDCSERMNDVATALASAETCWHLCLLRPAETVRL